MMKHYLMLLFFSCFISASQTDSLSENLLNNGLKAYSIGDYQTATNFFLKCIENTKASVNKNLLGRAYNNLGNVYSKTGKSEESLKNYLFSASLFIQIKDLLNTARAYKNIGALYAEQKDFSIAVKYYNLSIEIAKKI